MNQAHTCSTAVPVLFFILVSAALTGVVYADCNGDPCPFSPFSGNSSLGCGDSLSICTISGTCAFNTLPVNMGLMTPGIAASTLSGPAPLSVQFRDTAGASEGSATWTWDFGDGSTGTGISPVHVYQVPGTYNVTLSVSRGEKNANLEWGLSATTQRTMVITVTPGATVQQQAVSPVIVEKPAGSENSPASVYTPPAGFARPDISRYGNSAAGSAVQNGAGIHIPSSTGIYGY